MHIFSNASFQFMYHLGNGVHIELEAGLHLQPEIETGVDIKTCEGFRFILVHNGVLAVCYSYCGA